MPIAESLDHFVVPVDDLVAADEFYARVFDGQITKRNGLNVRQRRRGAVPHTFIKIGGKRMGVYLQSDHRPEPEGARGLPTYSFTTTDDGLDALGKVLDEIGTRREIVGNAHAFARRTIFFTDPAGNHYAVYTPRDGAQGARAAGRMTGVGYIELEAPSVDASIAFYEQVLGFAVESRAEKQATLTMASGQTLILTEAPFAPKGLVMSRKVPGPHIAFYVRGASWPAALAHLAQHGVENGDRGAAKERTGTEGGTYMDDPAGYVIQFITDGME